MSHEMLGIVAGLLAIGGYAPYIYSTIRGSTKPNRATWLIWTIVGGLLAFSYIAEGDTSSMWLPLGYFIGPLLVAILSIRYGYAHWTLIDTICIIAAVVSIIPWLMSDNASITLIANVLIDAVGAIPTLIKTYREPETEDFTAWMMFFVANVLQLFAITNWESVAVFYPIYLFFLATAMIAFTGWDKIKRARG